MWRFLWRFGPFFITGLLILILYYENTILDTPFEHFMDSQSYGVRILFTAFGTSVGGFWDYCFSRTWRGGLVSYTSLRWS